MFGFGSDPNASGGGGGVEPVPDVASLSALPVVEEDSGKLAWVVATGQLYVLRNAISTVPDGTYVVATADDPSRQWVHGNISDEGAILFRSPLIDLTVVGQTIIVPQMSLFLWIPLLINIVVVTKDGTVTVSPTVKAGVAAGNADVCAAQTPAFFTTAPQGARGAILPVAPSAGTSVASNSLAAQGLILEVTVGATLGTATQLKGRAFVPAQLRTAAWNT